MIEMEEVRKKREEKVKEGKEKMKVIVGKNLKGERIDGEVLDGEKEKDIFKGDLKKNNNVIFENEL